MNELISIKLTDKGRELLCKGELTYSYYSLGDSEVDYNVSTNYITRSFNRSPNITSYLQESVSCNKLFELTGCSCTRRKYITKRTKYGLFDKDTIELTNFIEDFMIITGSTTSNPYNGSKQFDLSGTTTEDFGMISDGDIMMIKVCNNDYCEPLLVGNSPLPLLFFKITKNGVSTIVDLDRPLPYIPTYSGDTEFAIYPSSALYYESGSTIDFDNFHEDCILCTGSTPDFAKVSNVRCEGLIGASGCTMEVSGYTSSHHLGTMRYLGYCGECPDSVGTTAVDCADTLQGIYDSRVTSVAILEFDYIRQHYLFVNSDNLFRLHIPHIMWHRRDFGGSGLGDTAGMNFVSDTVLKLTDNGLEYYELKEDINYIGGRTPIVVGRIYPQLNIATIHNAELVAATSFVSNRNWTLPRLQGRMVYPVNGANSGILPVGKTLYLTYSLDSDFGVTYSFPQQVLLKFVNNTNIDRDVSFTLEEGGVLPYMRKREPASDGRGFDANRFNILYQITDNEKDYPLPDGWNEVNFTNNYLTVNPYETIDPLRLEGQDPQLNQFYLTKERVQFVGEEIYSLSGYCIDCTDSIVGAETVFIGNTSFSSGKDLYRKTVNILIGSNINKTDNTTYGSGNLKVSDIGIYDNNMQLVMMGKVRIPIELMGDAPTEIEMVFDF